MRSWVEITDENDLETLKTFELMLHYGTLVDEDVANQGQKRRWNLWLTRSARLRNPVRAVPSMVPMIAPAGHVKNLIGHTSNRSFPQTWTSIFWVNWRRWTVLDEHLIMERLEKLEWQFDFLLRYLNEKEILPDTAILSMNKWVRARTNSENMRRWIIEIQRGNPRTNRPTDRAGNHRRWNQRPKASVGVGDKLQCHVPNRLYQTVRLTASKRCEGEWLEIRHNEEGWWIGPYPDYLDAELDLEALVEFIEVRWEHGMENTTQRWLLAKTRHR